MSRRTFLQLLSVAATGAVSACSTPPRPPGEADPQRAKIRAIAFDLFTLFDPRTVIQVAEAIVPGKAAELCEAWRTRQFEYAWLLAAGGQYADFRAVTEQALAFATKARRISLSTEEQRTLVSAYERLDPWPDTRATLLSWKRSGLRLAPLANYSPSMLHGLVDHAGLGDVFETLISTDRAKTYKPDPRAYALGVEAFALRREEIAFSAFGGWDAVGARWFGFPTFWVNRLGVPQEELTPAPDGTGASLAELDAWMKAWA